MESSGLFLWWVISITWSIVFLTVISIYLYAASMPKREKDSRPTAFPAKLAKDFVFVWVLMSLLLMYVVSVNRGSEGSILFAAGNIVVEAALITHLFMNRTRNSEQVPAPQERA